MQWCDTCIALVVYGRMDEWKSADSLHQVIRIRLMRQVDDNGDASTIYLYQFVLKWLTEPLQSGTQQFGWIVSFSSLYPSVVIAIHFKIIIIWCLHGAWEQVVWSYLQKSAQKTGMTRKNTGEEEEEEETHVWIFWNARAYVLSLAVALVSLELFIWFLLFVSLFFPPFISSAPSFIIFNFFFFFRPFRSSLRSADRRGTTTKKKRREKRAHIQQSKQPQSANTDSHRRRSPGHLNFKWPK